MTVLSSVSAVFPGTVISRALPITSFPDVWGDFKGEDPVTAFRNTGTGDQFTVVGAPNLNGVSAGFTQSSNKLLSNQLCKTNQTFVAIAKRPENASIIIGNYGSGSSNNSAGDSLILSSVGALSARGSFGMTGQYTTFSLSPSVEWSSNNMRFIAGTWAGNSMLIYMGVGGVIESASGTITGTRSLSSRVIGIGGSSSGSVQVSLSDGNPEIAEAMIFSDTLSLTDLNALYQFSRAYYSEMFGLTIE